MLEAKVNPKTKITNPPIDPSSKDKEPEANGLLHFFGWFLSASRSNKSLKIYTDEATQLKAKNAKTDSNIKLGSNVLAAIKGMKTRIFLIHW